MRVRICTTILCLLFVSATALAQRIALSTEVGYDSTQFGDPSNTNFKYVKRSSEFIDFAPQIILFGDTHREAGWAVTADGDLLFPFDSSDATGNPMEFAGNFLLNDRTGNFSIGFGMQGREFLLPSEPGSAFIRPDQFLFGVPFMAKYSFGPGHRGYIQGGATEYLFNYSQNIVSAFGQTVLLNGSGVSLGNCFAKGCGDIKINGGYIFGHYALKGGYIYRTVHFSLSNSTAFDPSIMDFHQNQLYGGIVLTF